MTQFNYSEAEIAEFQRKGAVVTPHPVRVTEADTTHPTGTGNGSTKPGTMPAWAAPGDSIDPCTPLLFISSCEHYGLPGPVPEYRFHPDRKWRFDYAWPDKLVTLEIEGGAGFGRHSRRKGFINDIEKYNAATLAGWRLLRCIPADVKDESVFALLKLALARPQLIGS